MVNPSELYAQMMANYSVVSVFGSLTGPLADLTLSYYARGLVV